jgi:hypothetical protein
MAMIHLPPDFKEFFQLLNSHQVEYLIIGGYAVSYHGYPRATGDIDVWVAIHPENVDKIISAIKNFGFENPELNRDLFLKDNQVIRMGIPPLRIEVITAISGVHFKECYVNRQTEMVEDVPVNFISLSDLKKNKKACGRPKDLLDLDNLP